MIKMESVMDDGQHRHSDQLHDPVQTNQDMMIRIVIMIMVIKILIMMMTIGIAKMTRNLRQGRRMFRRS